LKNVLQKNAAKILEMERVGSELEKRVPITVSGDYRFDALVRLQFYRNL
jgi:hypothetical protein